MAKVGFEYTVMAKLASGTAMANAIYTDGIYMGPNSAFNFSPNSNDVKDYGDDRVVETDTSVIDGTVSVEHNELTAEQEAYMLGHALNNGVIVSSADDIAPYLGIGFVGKSKRNGALKYTAKFYPKTQFREPGDDNATKQDSVSFQHSTLEGNMFTLESGEWKKAKEFDTLAAAKEWLNGLVGIGADPAVYLNKNQVTLEIDGTETLTAVTNPGGKTVTWDSDNDEIATVTDGVVTGVAAGNAVITAEITVDGVDYTAACAVHVNAAASS